MASRARARHLVLNHLIFGAGGGPADIAADASAAYDGPVTVGSDLQTFTLGPGGG